jgi:transcriptional regulator with XRE-family HTH domain
MAEINERIKVLREHLGLTQTALAEKINRAPNTINQYEKGKNIPDRTILDICNAFNANELWLRTGSGEMFRQETNVDVELAHQVGRLIKSDDDFTKRLVLEYLKLPPELKTAFEEFVDKLYQEHKKE